jgi:putative peptidoglycan lipid II flippase
MKKPAVKSLGRNGVLLSSAALASRLLGWVRITVLIAIFGATGQLDPLLAAFRLPDIVFGLVAAGSFSTVLVPALAGLHARGEVQRARALLASFFLLIGSVLLLLFLLAFAASDLFSEVVFAGMSIASRAEARDLSRILLFSTSLLALSSIGAAAAAAADRFIATAANGIIYNLGTIAGALIGGVAAGGFGAAVGTATGALLVFALSLRALANSPFRPSVPDLRDPMIPQLFRSLAPRIASAVSVQVLFAYFIGIAAGLGPGSITVWSYAFTLLQVPLALVSSAMATAILPRASRMAAKANLSALAGITRESIGVVATLYAPMIWVGIVLAPHLVGLATGIGSSAEAVDQMAALLSILLLGLCGHGVTALLMRIFYSLGDTVRPTLSDFAYDVMGVAIAALLLPTYGLAALAVALSASAWAQAALLSWQIRRRVPQLRWWDLFGQQLAPLLLALPAASAAYLLIAQLDNLGVSPVTDLVRLVAGGSAAVAVYLVALFAIQPPASTPLAVALFKAVPVMRRLVRLGGARSRWSAGA